MFVLWRCIDERLLTKIVFIAAINTLQLWEADDQTAYLAVNTKEKVYIGGDPEFGSLEGHVLVTDYKMYGIMSSGMYWYQSFSDLMRSIDFTPSKAYVYQAGD
jgi:hypothetical protein